MKRSSKRANSHCRFPPSTSKGCFCLRPTHRHASINFQRQIVPLSSHHSELVSVHEVARHTFGIHKKRRRCVSSLSRIAAALLCCRPTLGWPVCTGRLHTDDSSLEESRVC